MSRSALVGTFEAVDFYLSANLETKPICNNVSRYILKDRTFPVEEILLRHVYLSTGSNLLVLLLRSLAASAVTHLTYI